ncbi:hypothetical protein M8C21_025718 [Ambrosia artemisiifolia]|uniref:Dehydrin n=1 Tax=Ambrosia artemisiifolia TaxID=4212 RepID=A0AAD5GDY9_AMBAR|nr:hypothetical protein M8C21_025718 [Ambrosia artemisiifolia]
MHLQSSTSHPYINPFTPIIFLIKHSKTHSFHLTLHIINFAFALNKLFTKKNMAEYGGQHEQYKKEEGQHNQLHSTATGHEIGGTGTNVYSATAGHDVGGTGVHGGNAGYNVGGTGATGGGGGHGYEEGKHGVGGILHRSGSGSSSSSEDDGQGGRRKKKGVVEKIKEKLPGGDHGGDEHKTSATTTVGGGGYGNEGEEGHEKKGIMDKIKEKLPGSHQ